MRRAKYYHFRYIHDTVIINGVLIKYVEGGVRKEYNDGVKHFISNNWYD